MRKNRVAALVPWVRLFLACLPVLLASVNMQSSAWARQQAAAQGSAAQSHSGEEASTPGSQTEASRTQGEKNKRYAVISGTVFDAHQMSVFGVKVKIRRVEDKKARWEAYSDHSGEFAQRVPPGPADYVVWADVRTGKGESKPEKTVHVYGDELTTVFLHLDAPGTPNGKSQ